MSEQTIDHVEIEAPAPVDEEVVDVVEAEQEAPTEEAQEEDVIEETVEPDMVAQAVAEQARLKAELEALKNSDTNIFEKNEILKKELEDAKKLQEMAVENQRLQDQLTAIKKNSLVDCMVADGRLNNDLREWAIDMSYEKLQLFAAKAPKVKNILQQTNTTDTVSDNMEEFKKQQSQSRIL